MKRARSQQGFTLIEVMMALTVLAIGLLGIVALQTATISSTQDAQQFTVANAVLNTWIQRLQRDAQRWNHPSKYNMSSSDLSSDTAWLNLATSASDVWLRPGASGLEPNASPAFDRNGLDVPLSDTAGQLDRAIYCTHIRLRMIYPDDVSGGLIRGEVRVFWAKRRLGDGALFAGYGMNTGICTTTGNEKSIGADRVNFHWVYAMSNIPKAQAQ